MSDPEKLRARLHDIVDEWFATMGLGEPDEPGEYSVVTIELAKHVKQEAP